MRASLVNYQNFVKKITFLAQEVTNTQVTVEPHYGTIQCDACPTSLAANVYLSLPGVPSSAYTAHLFSFPQGCVPPGNAQVFLSLNDCISTVPQNITWTSGWGYATVSMDYLIQSCLPSYAQFPCVCVNGTVYKCQPPISCNTLTNVAYNASAGNATIVGAVLGYLQNNVMYISTPDGSSQTYNCDGPTPEWLMIFIYCTIGVAVVLSIVVGIGVWRAYKKSKDDWQLMTI